MTPLEVKISWGGVTFSRPVVQNLMLKFEPCQLLTLKNDPGSQFYRWKMTRGVIFQRGHYLMLHRNYFAVRPKMSIILLSFCEINSISSLIVQ